MSELMIILIRILITIILRIILMIVAVTLIVAIMTCKAIKTPVNSNVSGINNMPQFFLMF